MNVERLYATLKELQVEYQALSINQLMQSMINALSASISQNTPQAAQQFEEAKDKIHKVLHDSPSNGFAPSRHKIIQSIKADVFCGNNLSNRIDAVLSVNNITPAKALDELQKIRKESADFFALIQTMITSFEKIGVTSDELKNEEYEIGILLPTGLVQGDLEKFDEELHELSRHIKAIAEAVGEKSDNLKIRSLASGSVDIFLASAGVVAATMAHIIERIVRLYKDVLEIRLHQQQLEALKAPQDSVIKGLREYEKEMIQKVLSELRDQIIEQHTIKDKGRKNELKTMLTNALRYLADRIDKGVDFEVNAAIKQKETSPSEDGTSNKKGENENLAIVNAKGASLRFIERQAAPVLCLPPETKKEKSDGKE